MKHMGETRTLTWRLGVLGVVGLLALVTPAGRAATPVPPANLVLAPLGNTVAYSSIAIYDPVLGKAHLYSASRLTPRESPELSWINGIAPVDASVSAEPGIYDATWDDGTSIAPLIVSTSPYTRKSNVVVLVPDYTWHAYSDTGNGSFYVSTEPDRTKRRVSMERPLRFERSDREIPDGYANPVMPFANPIAFLREQLGSVDVVAQSLIDTLPYDLSKYDMVVLYAHDEYWTPSLRARIEAAVSSGTSLLNMSGNTAYRKLIRTGTVLGAEPQGTIWGANPADTTISELTGAAFLGYPLDLTLQKNKSSVRLALYNRYRRNGFPKSVRYSRFLKYTSGMVARPGSNPLFAGTRLARGGFFGVRSHALGVEVDGLPLGRRGQSIASWESGRDPALTVVSADGWVGSRGTRGGVIVQHWFGSGRVVTIGSIQWAKALVGGDPDVAAITANAARMLLAPMESGLLGYQWSEWTRLSGKVAVAGYVTLKPGTAAAVTVTCKRLEVPRVATRCSGVVARNGAIVLRVPSRAAVRAEFTVDLAAAPQWILVRTPNTFTGTVTVYGPKGR